MLTSLKVGGHQNLWTRKMLGIEMAVEVQILQQILQDLQVILLKMILRYVCIRHHLRYSDCLVHPNLSATLATDQK